MATLADPRIDFTRVPHPAPVPAAERDQAIADPGFGKVFTDHMVTIEWTEGRGWHDATLGPRGPLTLDPAAAVLHYAQEIFEGLKAYRLADGSMALFRPEENARRFNASAARLAMPELPEETFVEAVRQLVLADRDWFPPVEGGSLYLRPFMFASEAVPRRAAGQAVQVPRDRQPGRQLLQVGRAGGVDLGLARTTPAPRPAAPARPSAAATTPPAWCRRPRRSRTGTTRWCSSTPPSTAGSRSSAGMNVFFVFDDGTLVTPPLVGHDPARHHPRQPARRWRARKG